MATIPTPWDAPSEWTVTADASIGGSSVTLTPNVNFNKGTCYWETVISGTDTVDCTFTLTFGSPAADGAAFAIWDNADPDRVGAEGGNLGFFPDCTGWIVAVDTFQGGDPADDYLGIKDNGGILSWFDIPDPAGTGVDVRVRLSGGNRIEAWYQTLTGTPTLDQSVTLPTQIQVGFCAGCGGSAALQTLTAFSATVTALAGTENVLFRRGGRGATW